MKLGSLKPWAANPRLSTKAQAKRLLESFDQFGQVETIAIDSEYNVLDGHQRLSALLTIHGADYEIDARQASRTLTEDERKKLEKELEIVLLDSQDDDDKLQAGGVASTTLGDVLQVKRK